ncbi:MAG TPA: hypothetical protein VM032_11665, partial [Vicinamibacterales bacterium]|nr:hypothetical protein [Vicinamibacterales bacterium]
VRRPDLVLTPLLLSAGDDGLLTRRLRECDADSAPLQTLVTPVLDSGDTRPTPPGKPAGLLHRLRRAKATVSGGDGCAPAVFAAQIAEYLARMAAERREQDDARRANEWVAPSAGASAPMLGEWLTGPVSSPWSEPQPAEPEVTREALQSFLDDLDGAPREAEVAPVAAVDEPEPDVAELPPPDELWAPLAATPHQMMAPLEGPVVSARPASATKIAKAARPMPKGAPPVEPRRPQRPKAAPKPMQDEWGLYDPEQCGFAALLERLRELTDAEPPAKERQGRSAIMRR